MGKSLIFFEQGVCLLKNLTWVGLNMLKLEAVTSIPQRPRRYSPQLVFLSIKALYHMTCKHEEILSHRIALLQLTPNQSLDVIGKWALPQNRLCCFILLATKEALRVDLHFLPSKFGFCWQNIVASSTHKGPNLRRDVQGP